MARELDLELTVASDLVGADLHQRRRVRVDRDRRPSPGVAHPVDRAGGVLDLSVAAQRLPGLGS
jgi:hypothetical protein